MSKASLIVGVLAAGAGAMLAAHAAAQTPTETVAQTAAAPSVAAVEVTATRTPRDPDQVAAFISLIDGADLRAREVRDLRGALATVAGVEAPPGGDAGPASAVPAFWGLHEFDAFLLVVDGVPLGGAFNPAIPDLDLQNVARVEVLRGSAPVLYGATAFVGVIQVVHLPAGAAPNTLELGAGEYGSWRAAGSFSPPPLGAIEQSLRVDASRDGYSDAREHVGRLQGGYRAAAPLEGGVLRLDVDAQAIRSTPTSPVELEGTALTRLKPLDANYNPADARLDEDRWHGVLTYSHPTALGAWETTASLAASKIADVRGFLRPNLVDADSQNQRRSLDDDYFDSHLVTPLGGSADVTWGADLLYGRGKQTSLNGGYLPALDGGAPLPRTSDLHVDEINALSDRRLFIGEYAQVDARLPAGVGLTAGLRLNETFEHKLSTHLDGFDSTLDTSDSRTRRVTRPSGALGATWRAWRSGSDEAVLYANARDTFKPAAVDFGPDNTPDILKPETARSYEVGIKGRLLNGRLEGQAGVFRLDFQNLVVATTDAAGDPIHENAGGERLEGVEAEARWRAPHDVSVNLAISWHDARFTHYVASEGGANIDVSGRQLTFAPHLLAGAGLVYAPSQGVFGSATFNYVGERYLDLANTARAGAYTTLDARLGYRWGRYSLALNATNLGDARPPVTASEFGDQSDYRLPGRRISFDTSATF